MNEPPFFSIIVPVYNTAHFLPDCVGSILRQSFTSYELILVDDGSTDASAEICDDFAGRDCRVRCIHKPNGGVSSARNAGLDSARGRYVWFCDSDDTVCPGALEELHSRFVESCPSIIAFPVEQVDSAGAKVGLVPAPRRSRDKDEGPLQCDDLLYPYAHVFSRELADGERFDTALALLEDRDFFYRIVWKASGATAVIDRPLYRYLVTREDSAVNSLSVGKSVEATRVQYEIFLNESALGHPMPAFKIFASNSVGVLSLVARSKSDPDGFETVRSRLVEQRGNASMLRGALRIKYALAVYMPRAFKTLARLTGIAKKKKLGSTVIVEVGK